MRRYLVTLLLPLLLAAQQPPSKASITGHVTNAATGEPLKKARVHLELLAPSAKVSMVMSNADGSFEFTNIDPGSYEISASRTGFLDTTYGAKKPHQAGSILTLAAGQQVTDLTLALMPQAVISGRVVDEDGDPVENAMVDVSTQTWQGGKLSYTERNRVNSDDRGEFRVAGLEPGKYLLSAQFQNYPFEPANEGEPKTRPVTTYYSGSTSVENATPIEVQSGQQMSIEMRMLSGRTVHVRGKIAGPAPKESLHLSMIPEESDNPFAGESVAASVGDFDIAGVAPGTYRLTAFTFVNGPKSFGSQIVTVGETDVNGIVLNIIPPGSLHGRVRVEGAAPSASKWSATSANVSLIGHIAVIHPPGQISPKQDGTFLFEDVSAGAYSVQAAGGPEGAYLKSIRLNDQDVLNKEIDLSQGVSGDLEVVFRYGAAELDGTVQLPQEASSVPIFNIVLVADEDSRQQQSTMSDQNGAFTFKGLTPGQYHVYAFEQLNANQLENPAVLKAVEEKGTAVELKENDKKQLELSVISADDMQQILAKLGLQ